MTIHCLTYRILNEFSHDPQNFTQGIHSKGKILYESTGGYGQSSLQKIDLATGNLLLKKELPSDCFGEGLALLGDEIFQLTWESKKVFVYDKDSFQLIETKNYTFKGWGLTTDGKSLILSDGTSSLKVIDPSTFEVKKVIDVTCNGYKVEYLNDIAFFSGEVFANIWLTDFIARISLETGKIIGWINLESIKKNIAIDESTGACLNGITHKKKNIFLITGKLWPKLYEIEVFL